MDSETFKAQRTDLVKRNAGDEEILHAARQSGLGIIECIKLIRSLRGVSLGDAKTIVHFSETWADLREESEALHELASTVAREFADSRKPTPSKEDAG